MTIAVRILRSLIRVYRLVISPHVGPRCRFLPTCSDYALDALARHGAIRGGWLVVRRLARCQPFGGSGFDPVPEVFSTYGRTPAGDGGEASPRLSGRHEPKPGFQTALAPRPEA